METNIVKAKKLAKKLLEMYPERFTSDFNTNKKALVELTTVSSKKMQNVVAGYISRLIKKHTKISR